MAKSFNLSSIYTLLLVTSLIMAVTAIKREKK